MNDLALWQIALGAFCAFAIGVGKTGLPGVTIFVVPSMVLLVGDARLAAAWLLPILSVADVFAVWYWRRHVQPRQLFRLVPWVVIGMVIGGFALSWPERTIRYLVGTIVLLMLVLYLWRRWRPKEVFVPVHPSPYGIAAGIATTVANAAGSIMNLYLLSMRLPKEQFIATSAWFFFIINLTKVPIYIWHGLFSRQSLIFDLWMIAPAVAGAMTGRWVVQHIDQRTFELAMLILAAVASIALFR